MKLLARKAADGAVEIIIHILGRFAGKQRVAAGVAALNGHVRDGDFQAFGSAGGEGLANR